MSESYCTNCGSVLEKGAVFCVECGTPVAGKQGAAGEKKPQAPKPSLNKTLFMGSGMSAIKPVEAGKKPQKSSSKPQAKPKASSLQSGAMRSPPSPSAPQSPPSPSAPQSPPSPSAPQSPPPPSAPQSPPPPSAPQSPPPPSAPQSSPALQMGFGGGVSAEEKEEKRRVPLGRMTGPEATVGAPESKMPGSSQPSNPADRIRGGGTLVGLTLNNRYRVKAKIGEGGFGSIYCAEQIQMGRDVALKVLNPSMTSDEKLVERFRREARSACSLRDPHTIITYDFDQTSDGLLYIAMELLRGKNLFEIQENEDLFEPMRVVSVLEQCCSSLAEAHNHGIIHRDIKPENIVLEKRGDNPDFVKILDFGIAKIVSGEQDQNAMVLTAAGQTLGTLEYMSPEQLKGKELDGRSDIYALGILAYEMITGDIPFDGDTPAALIRGHLQQVPEPPSKVVPKAGVPPELDRIVAKMLEKEREARYRDVVELRSDLQRLLKGFSHVGGVSVGESLNSAAIPINVPVASSPVASPSVASASQDIIVRGEGIAKSKGLWWKLMLALVVLGAVAAGGILAWFYLK